MTDQSHLDNKYFIDEYVYNCPFCNRRNVKYQISSEEEFDWSNEKTCYVYYATCSSCSNVSQHLSFQEIPYSGGYGLSFKQYLQRIGPEERAEIKEKNIELDDLLFVSIPSSFATIDTRIPRILRELYSEAETSLKNNLLTGASACIRKLIYELARLHKARGKDYNEKIKGLKKILTNVDATYFDTLTAIQEVTSEKVHENSYDNWEGKDIKLILATVFEVLQEIYVAPELSKGRSKKIQELRQKILKDREEKLTRSKNVTQDS